MMWTRFSASYRIYRSVFFSSSHTKTARGTKGLDQTLRCMIWRMVVLDFPSIAVLRTGRLAVVAPAKCECLALYDVISDCAAFRFVVISIDSNPDNVLFFTLYFDDNLAAILVCHFTGEVLLEAVSRNSDKSMVELPTLPHGGKMRDLHSVSDEQMRAFFHKQAT